jgi:hypothetical protein
MGFEGRRGPVAACGLGRNLALVAEARVPTDCAGLPDTEALCRLTPRRSRFDDSLAQID